MSRQFIGQRGPVSDHVQDARFGFSAVTKEQAAAMRAGIALDGLIEVFAQGDERINKIISSLLTALADALGAKKAGNKELTKLREEN